jgi:hypothetical protein
MSFSIYVAGDRHGVPERILTLRERDDAVR